MSRPPVSPFTATPEEWRAHLRSRWQGAPGWAFDRDWINSIALDHVHLPRVVAALHYDERLGTIRLPDWWPGAGNWKLYPHHHLEPDPEARPVYILRSARDGDALTFLNVATGEWQCPSLALQGEDLVAMGCWRWGLSAGKSAWRLARLCNQRTPRP